MAKFTTDAFIDIISRSIIWAVVGLVFGGAFIPSHVLLQQWVHPFTSLIFASTLAGTLGALVYSSLGLSVMASLVGCFSTVAYLIILADQMPLLPVLPVIAGLGGLVGLVYGLKVHHSRIHQASAKGLAGFCAGVLASSGVILVKLIYTPLPTNWAIGAICLLTGLIYAMVVNQFAQRYSTLLPSSVAGVVVGMSVAAFISCIVWITSSEFNPYSSYTMRTMAATILQLVPYAFFGAMLGGIIIGTIRTIYDVDWLDI